MWMRLVHRLLGHGGRLPVRSTNRWSPFVAIIKQNSPPPDDEAVVEGTPVPLGPGHVQNCPYIENETTYEHDLGGAEESVKLQALRRATTAADARLGG